MKFLQLAVIFTAWTSAAGAQDWQARSFDNGALIHGMAFTADAAFTLSCTAPSPDGGSLIDTGDHESLRTDTPYDLVVSFSIGLIDPFGISHDLPTPQLLIDGVSYPLPAMNYSDFYGSWTGWTRFDGPGVLELFDAQSVTVDTGAGVSRDYSGSGLAAAMSGGLSPCLVRWLELGHPLPPILEAHINRNEPGAAPAYAPAPAQAFPIPQSPPQAALSYIVANCGGSFDADPTRIGSADFDRDGLADYVLDWNDITCQGNLGPRPNCGAANCLISVFLSSRDYATPEELLAIGFTIVTLPDGRPGMLTSGTVSACQAGACDVPWAFDGHTLSR